MEKTFSDSRSGKAINIAAIPPATTKSRDGAWYRTVEAPAIFSTTRTPTTSPIIVAISMIAPSNKGLGNAIANMIC
ncbi:MAG: hypothetical protein ACI906_002736 [Candidatus Latescibacterota bacterium]|jgi:hypothetical protein